MEPPSAPQKVRVHTNVFDFRNINITGSIRISSVTRNQESVNECEGEEISSTTGFLILTNQSERWNGDSYRAE